MFNQEKVRSRDLIEDSTYALNKLESTQKKCAKSRDDLKEIYDNILNKFHSILNEKSQQAYRSDCVMVNHAIDEIMGQSKDLEKMKDVAYKASNLEDEYKLFSLIKTNK